MTDNNHLSITPAVEAGPVPEGFRPDFARAALRGDWRGLHGFTWRGTRQGYDFWENEDFRFDADLSLTPEAASILREWIKQTEARS